MHQFLSFQEIIARLNQFWQAQGCVLVQPLDMEVGAGTFHPSTFLRSIGPEPWRSAYVQPSRRPADGRYGNNPNRLQHYYQYQVLLKPAPATLQQLYLQSLQVLGIDLKKNDVRFVEDNWESPTLGAWGLGWEVWLNGMEVTQFTYFQKVGGLDCHLISGELTYGLERLAMYLQGVNTVYDLLWTQHENQSVTYHQVYHQNEVEQSQYNFELANIDHLLAHFEHCYQSCCHLLEQKLPLPAYEQVMKASHLFNLLDARKAISVTERQRYIFRVRELSHRTAVCYADKRETLGYPLGVLDKPEATVTASSTYHHLGAMTQADFLFELGCEELPIDAVLPLAEGLKMGFEEQLKNHALAYEKLDVYATPRRLAIKIQQLDIQQRASEKVRKGPRCQAAKKAHLGFAKSCGVALAELSSECIDGIDYLVHKQVLAGRHFSELLPQMLDSIIAQLPMKKAMRWQLGDFQFVRPVRWLVALLDTQVVPCVVFDIESSASTYGHRMEAHSEYLTGVKITLKHASEYDQKLREHAVIADFSTRQSRIKSQLMARAGEFCATVNMDEDLLNQVCSLTEFPTVVIGDFPRRFLKLPKECLISTLQSHQKYFTLSDDKGDLLPMFLTVSNLPTEDFSWVKKGNERVVIPRLEDAEFFWKNDLQKPLYDYLESLKSVVFVESLGSVYQKVQRVKQLACHMAISLRQDEEKIARACDLMKCDLVTDMVNEFPDLQGIMGQYYALEAGEDRAVATVITDHYLPKKAHGDLPKDMLSAIVAIADKLDTIVGIHIIQKQPTGNSDPFSLRRLALGVMQILQQHKITLSVESLISTCIENWQPQLSMPLSAELAACVDRFMWARLYTLYTQDKQIPATVYQAVMAVKPVHPYELMERLHALQKFVKLPIAKILSETNRRIKNILQKNQADFVSLVNGEIDLKLFEYVEEKTLFDCLARTEQGIKKTDNYLKILTILSELSVPVENFFNHVMVFDEEISKRDNRLRLLARLRQQFLLVADISLLQL